MRRTIGHLPRQQGLREAGVATVELVIATPLLLALLMTVIQAALYWHGAHVAQAAASQALAAARVQGSTPAAGQAQGERILAQLASGVLPQRAVTVTRAPTAVTVQVTGTVESLIPGLHLHVTALAAGPVEEWK